jgi:hypothetical protein
MQDPKDFVHIQFVAGVGFPDKSQLQFAGKTIRVYFLHTIKGFAVKKL